MSRCRTLKATQTDVYEKAPECMIVSTEDRDISLVERLRLGGPNAAEVAGQAADEIERLREEVKLLRSTIDKLHSLAAQSPF